MFQFWQAVKKIGMTPQECLNTLQTKVAKKIMLDAAIGLFLQELKALHSKKRYQRSVKSVLGQFSAFFPGIRVDQLTREDIQRWRDSGEYAPASRRTRLTDVKTFAKFATFADWAHTNPCLGVKAPKVVLGAPGVLNPRQAD